MLAAPASARPPRREAPTTSSPARAHARASQLPANPDAPVIRTRNVRKPTARAEDGVLERAVAVARVVGVRLRRRRLGLGVEPALELAEHDPEQQVAPGRLRERAAVADELRELLAGRMEAVGRRAPSGHRTTCSASAAAGPRSAGGSGSAGAMLAYTAPNSGAVLHVQREPDRIPAVAARDRPAEQLDVVVAAAEHELVERLLDAPTRPPRRRRRRRLAACGCGRCRGSRTATVTGGAATGTAMCDGSRGCCTSGRGRRAPTSSSTGSCAPLLQPFFHIYFRMSRIGREHIPAAGPGDRRRQPPQLPRPVRDRDDGAPADVLRRQEGAVRAPLAGVAPERARRLPGRPRRRRRRHDRDRQGDPRARRHRADLPRGHADPARLARQAQARRRPARARDRGAGRPGRRDRHRGGPPRLADPPAQGPDPRRPRRSASRRSRTPRRRWPARSPTGSGRA